MTTPATPPRAGRATPSCPADPPLPLSVWPCAQQPHRWQRAGRYLPAASAHPAKMLPELARRVISTYTKPGELVLDPMCGIGTTLVEAVHLGRDAVGVELEARWAALARANLAHAAAQGATGTARAITGDGRRLDQLLPPRLRGKAALVLSSPPYGPFNHGRVRTFPDRPVAKWNQRYWTSHANLAGAATGGLLAGVEAILRACAPWLRPGGFVVLTARPWRCQGSLVDTPGMLARAAERAGLVPYERHAALLAGLCGDGLVPRHSFFALQEVRRARRRGLPLHVVAHEDVLVFQHPGPSRRHPSTARR